MLPWFVMLEVTRVAPDSFKISLIDKKHGDELDCEICELPPLPERDYSHVRAAIVDYKDALLVANVI